MPQDDKMNLNGQHPEIKDYALTSVPMMGYLPLNFNFQSRSVSFSVYDRSSTLSLQSDSSVDMSASARAHSLPAKGYTPAHGDTGAAAERQLEQHH